MVTAFSTGSDLFPAAFDLFEELASHTALVLCRFNGRAGGAGGYYKSWAL
jgi:hypothetical protein